MKDLKLYRFKTLILIEFIIIITTKFRTESQEVTLPEGFICSNCTIRLRKKAKEFGDHYIFWSCADIDIVSRTGGVAENCLQNDKNVQSHVGCQCNKGRHRHI
jgi:ssDNA-binding Zn-finger/Zn-ribbon topoisomerase 1